MNPWCCGPRTVNMDGSDRAGGGQGPATKRRRVWIGSTVALVIIAVLAVVSLAGGSPTSPAQTGAAGNGAGQRAADPTTGARLAVPRRQPGDPLALGPVNAPVVVAEWGDFQCPFCRVFNQSSEPALLRQYVDTGQVRFEWHDFAYLGPESVLGARAARAAGRQGKFWQYHDALYNDQPRENTGAVTAATLTATAARLGLNVPEFQRDDDDPAIAQAVTADQADGTRLGIAGVPSFVIGSQLIFGAQPLATFQQAIDPALAQAR